MDMLEIWNQVLKNLEGNVSPVGFNIHIFHNFAAIKSHTNGI